MLTRNTETLFGAVQGVSRLVRDSNIKSLPQAAKSAHVTPLCLVDEKVERMDQDIRNNIYQTVLSLVSMHYMQAVAAHGSVGDIRVIDVLDRFATERSVLSNPGGGWFELGKSFGLESYKPKSLNDFNSAPGLLGKGADEIINGKANMAVGKLLEVPVVIDSKEFKFDVHLRLSIKTLNEKNIVDTLAMDADDNSVKGRTFRLLAGELDIIDYLTTRDIIKQQRKGRINDKHGFYAAKEKRNSKNFFSSLVSGNSSLNAASSVAIISNTTASRLEPAIKGKFSRERVRDKFFEDTSSMMLVIVNDSMETLTIYTDSISDEMDLHFDDIKSMSSSSGAMDMNAVLSAYRAGSNPGL